jgi:hypothetical protein
MGIILTFAGAARSNGLARWCCCCNHYPKYLVVCAVEKYAVATAVLRFELKLGGFGQYYGEMCFE